MIINNENSDQEDLLFFQKTGFLLHKAKLACNEIAKQIGREKFKMYRRLGIAPRTFKL